MEDDSVKNNHQIRVKASAQAVSLSRGVPVVRHLPLVVQDGPPTEVQLLRLPEASGRSCLCHKLFVSIDASSPQPKDKNLRLTACQSHVICLECAHNIGFNDQDVPGKHCPVCKVELQTPEDVKLKSLHINEGYKTTILSGLSPDTIMECASRAINFWSYQAIQESYYRDHLYTTLKDKYSSLNMSAERMSNEAKAHIEALEKKLAGQYHQAKCLHGPNNAKATIAENEMYRQKNDELTNAYREKHRRLQQVQQLYDKAKRIAELGQLQQAATDEVNQTVLESGQLASKAFGRSFQGRDLDSFPSIPRFGVAQNGHAGGSSLNQGAPQSAPAHGGESTRWSKPAVPSRGE
jgi:E3 ubiquitin-protein ligase CCNP1IP1